MSELLLIVVGLFVLLMIVYLLILIEKNNKQALILKEKIEPFVRMNYLKCQQAATTEDINIKNKLLESMKFNNKKVLAIFEELENEDIWR